MTEHDVLGYKVEDNVTQLYICFYLFFVFLDISVDSYRKLTLEVVFPFMYPII